MLYLASTSPRRRELLQQIGLNFEVLKIAVDESVREDETPGEYVARLAVAKASSALDLVQGHGLVLAADIVLLAPQAVFKAHYATAGFGPDGGWTALVGRLAGRRRAASALLLNCTVRAEEAVAWGLASEIVAAEALPGRAEAAARRIAAHPCGTMRAAKSLLWGDREQLAADLEAERARFVELIAAPEALAGVDAFLRDFADYPDSQEEEEAKC